MQCLQDSYKNNVDNINNIQREGSRHFWNKKEKKKKKNDEVETNINTKNIRDLYRGINDFKKGYQPRTNIVKDENGNLVRLPQYFGYMEELIISAIKCTWG
jgi:hypothetical protein